MFKANSMLQYINGVHRGIEVNTSLMLYKSLVRAVADYGIAIYYPKEENLQTKLERAQYKGLRTALGYRNSTPNNVIIVEAKVMLLRDRAGMLACNLLSKTLIYGQESVWKNLSELAIIERFTRYKKSVITDAWETINSLKNKLGPTRKFEIYETDYWANTREIQIDYSIGGRRKRGEINDKQIVSEAIKVFKIEKNPTVMYTDGARSVNSISTGPSVIIEDQDTAYYSSSPKECSSFTAEAITIKAAIDIIDIYD